MAMHFGVQYERVLFYWDLAVGYFQLTRHGIPGLLSTSSIPDLLFKELELLAAMYVYFYVLYH